MSGSDLARWQGRVALVTGASSGIGQAIAADLASAGMRVAATARRIDRLEALAAGEGRVLPLAADLREEAQILALFDAVRARWGGVDVLVNSAGLGRMAPLTNGATADWREVLDVNVLALCIATREAVADMRRRGDDGHVIHVSSMSGHRIPGASGLYPATKHAVRALTEGLRLELRELDSRIRVTCVSPGFVKTEFAEVYHRSAAKAEWTYGRFEVLESEDIAAAVRYALAAPPHVQVHDVLLRSVEQPT